MLAQQHRMRTKAQFAYTTRSGARSGRRNLVVYTAKKTSETTQIGFIVSKAVGNAVTRNTVKRCLREIITPFVTKNPQGYLLVIRALPAAAQANYAQLTRDIEIALTATLAKLSDSRSVNPTREANEPSREED